MFDALLAKRARQILRGVSTGTSMPRPLFLLTYIIFVLWPTYTGGTMKATRAHYIHPDLYRIEAIENPREKAHALRAWRSEMRDNPKSPFNDVKNPDHKNAIEWIQRTYEAEAEIGPMPEDGE